MLPCFQKQKLFLSVVEVDDSDDRVPKGGKMRIVYDLYTQLGDLYSAKVDLQRESLILSEAPALLDVVINEYPSMKSAFFRCSESRTS